MICIYVDNQCTIKLDLPKMSKFVWILIHYIKYAPLRNKIKFIIKFFRFVRFQVFKGFDNIFFNRFFFYYKFEYISNSIFICLELFQSENRFSNVFLCLFNLCRSFFNYWLLRFFGYFFLNYPYL